MTPAKQRFNSFEEYLSYDNDTDIRYELVAGVLVEMPAESDINVKIAGFLYLMLAQVIPYYLLRRGTEIAVNSPKVTTHYPDLIVFTEELNTAMKDAKRSIVMPDMPAPALVIEAVSPGETNQARDYVDKRFEYAARGIPEYWLVDPEQQSITVLQLVNEKYREHGVFQGSDRINSPTFGLLQLTAAQILRAGE